MSMGGVVMARNLVGRVIGRWLCRLDMHDVKATNPDAVYLVMKCGREGCDHQYVEYWGGYRLQVSMTGQKSRSATPNAKTPQG